MANKITIALSKGRIFKETLPLFAKLGIKPKDDPELTRKLILDTNNKDVRFILIRATDVPTYVGYGAADMGIAGKDILMEYNGQALYEPLDLQIAKCRMMLAGIKGKKLNSERTRVATKYVETTRNYFAAQGKQVEIIKLYGSMELGPVLGLADLIVDLVDTGNTLKANGLEALETIAYISSRLIVNKASMKMKPEIIKPIIEGLDKVVNSG
jgi:ATP phosphoribosyltransferase